ncbi:MAG: hypothetical protein LC127_01995 [Chitinophagales bacterium]|nr:hypothetical protein [Chitinophagales bacterium]
MAACLLEQDAGGMLFDMTVVDGGTLELNKYPLITIYKYKINKTKRKDKLFPSIEYYLVNASVNNIGWDTLP